MYIYRHGDHLPVASRLLDHFTSGLSVTTKTTKEAEEECNDKGAGNAALSSGTRGWGRHEDSHPLTLTLPLSLGTGGATGTKGWGRYVGGPIHSPTRTCPRQARQHTPSLCLGAGGATSSAV